MQFMLFSAAALAAILAALLPSTGNARLDACLDAGLSPAHCRAWSAKQ